MSRASSGATDSPLEHGVTQFTLCYILQYLAHYSVKYK